MKSQTSQGTDSIDEIIALYQGAESGLDDRGSALWILYELMDRRLLRTEDLFAAGDALQRDRRRIVPEAERAELGLRFAKSTRRAEMERP